MSTLECANRTNRIMAHSLLSCGIRPASCSTLPNITTGEAQV